eukprot:scaffold442_cov397-Prasinococcus_capsulatus_cf.AAC.18
MMGFRPAPCNAPAPSSSSSSSFATASLGSRGHRGTEREPGSSWSWRALPARVLTPLARPGRCALRAEAHDAAPPSPSISPRRPPVS